MSSGPTPSITYKSFVELRPSPDGFLVGNVMSDAPGYTLKETASTGAGDNLGVFGDTPNEPISVTSPDGSPFGSGLAYYGKTDTNGSVVRFPTTGDKAGSYVYILFTDQTYQYNDVVPNASVSQTALVLCFGSGTHILTTRGEVTVENLRVGDRAITASGQHRTITWTGHRHLGAERPLPADQAPVRVRAGAFGHGLPKRDLLLSPGHPVLVGADAEAQGGALVPVMNLINGTTIARTSLASVTYWHVELDAHDILLAEGLPAESFLDFGCRPFFEEASDHRLHNPDFVPPGLAARCRPVALDGPLVEAERARLAAVFAQTLAEDCAWDEDARRFGRAAA